MTKNARQGTQNGMNRRHFSGLVGCAALGSALGQTWAQDTAQQLRAEEDVSQRKLSPDQPQIRILMSEADGSPLSKERSATLIARDMANDPLPQATASAEGRSRVGLAAEPIQIGMRLSIPGFGEVYCYADDEGRGYTKPGQLEFAVHAALTRRKRVQVALEAARKAGLPRDPELEKRMEAAMKPIPSTAGPAQIAAAYMSLSNSLHAGERLSLLSARHRISKLAKPRSDFLFGCLGSGWNRGADYDTRFSAAFNYATISWYSWNQNPDPVETRISYDRQDQSLAWCERHKITPKGFGYVYMANGATPEWFRSWPYEKVLPEYRRIVEQTCRRYHGRWPHVEVINEAHDKANIFRLSHEQILELTREACHAARRGSATVKRLLNHCCLWAEYARRANADGSRRWSPFRYLKDCVSAGVDFETVGLQLYYPQHDVFEIERMLDRFKVFNRPLQITELACASADGLDPASMRPTSLVPGWHGPWSESMQAEWLEAIYTLCYSKPEFEAVGWWDFADVEGHFWPYGGMLHKDFTPKASYHRLLALQGQWGVDRRP